MPVSVLSRMLVSDRRNMRTPERLEASIRSGVSSRPILNELEVEESANPLLVTNASRQFVQTGRSPARGTARYAFSEVPLDEEPQFLLELYLTLLQHSWAQNWSNRCNSVSEAVARFRRAALEPAFLIVPETVLPDICGPQYDPSKSSQLMMTQGYVATVDKMQVMTADLPSGAALLSLVPSFVGLYTRVGDYLGVMIQRADRALMVVGDDVA